MFLDQDSTWISTNWQANKNLGMEKWTKIKSFFAGYGYIVIDKVEKYEEDENGS